MPQCKKCGKKGLFLKIEGDTGLCLSCNEDFAREGKVLTQKITEAKSRAAAARDPKEVAGYCRELETYGARLVELQEAYQLPPSQELLDLIETYREKRRQAEE